MCNLFAIIVVILLITLLAWALSSVKSCQDISDIYYSNGHTLMTTFLKAYVRITGSALVTIYNCFSGFY